MDALPLAMLSPVEILVVSALGLAVLGIFPIAVWAIYMMVRSAARAGARDAEREKNERSARSDRNAHDKM